MLRYLILDLILVHKQIASLYYNAEGRKTFVYSAAFDLSLYWLRLHMAFHQLCSEYL